MWDGKNVYDIDDIHSIEYVDQKVNADGLAEGTGLKMDDFFPIFGIIIIDWLVNFMSTMVYFTLSFLFSFESSEIDTIQLIPDSDPIVHFLRQHHHQKLGHCRSYYD